MSIPKLGAAVCQKLGCCIQSGGGYVVAGGNTCQFNHTTLSVQRFNFGVGSSLLFFLMDKEMMAAKCRNGCKVGYTQHLTVLCNLTQFKTDFCGGTTAYTGVNFVKN